MKKAALIILLILVPLCFGQSITSGDNGLIIQLDESNGSFGIGDTVGVAGDSLIGRQILIDYNYPWSRGISHFIFSIDGSLYSNSYLLSGGCTYEMADDYLVDAGIRDDYLYAEWSIPIGDVGGSIIIQQILLPVTIDGQGQCKLSYIIYNGDSVRHDIGVMLNLDINLNGEDNAPFAAGGAYSGVGMYYFGSEVPYFWQSYEISPVTDENQLIAAGYLRGLDATAPQIFTFGDQMYLLETCWEISSATLDRYVGNSYIDTGMLLTWTEQQLNPDKYLTNTTYIGLGEATPSDDSLVLITLAPTTLTTNCTSVNPNPFEISVLVYNQSIPDGASEVQVCLDTPEGTSFSGDASHEARRCHTLPWTIGLSETRASAWLIEVDSSYIFSDEPLPFIFTMTTPSLPDTTLDTVWIEIPTPSGIPPTVESAFEYSFTSAEFDSFIWVPFIATDDEGIKLNSLRARSGPLSITYFSSWWYNAEDTLFLAMPLARRIHGDTVITTITELRDIPGCYADGLPISDTLIFDREPPEIVRTIPSDGSHVDSLPRVTFVIRDDPAGFDTTSITLIADGDLVNFDDDRLSYTDSSVTYQSTTVYELEDTIEICIGVILDNVDLGTQNASDSPECFSFWADPERINEHAFNPESYKLINTYPNPFNSEISVNLESPEDSDIDITVFDINGKITLEKHSRVNTGLNQISIDCESLNSGIYFMKIENSNFNETGKIILMK